MPCYSKAVSKVTTKFQVSIPKSLASELGVRPGDEIQWSLAGEELRISPARARRSLPAEERLELFDIATRRQAARNKRRRASRAPRSRGWTREELYDRGRTR